VSFVVGLRCRACGASYAPAPVHVCAECLGPLEVQYDYGELARRVRREAVAGGPNTMWRYRPLLPVRDDAVVVDLGTGFTPLLRADNLARALGLRHVYIKNDAVNPTYSFKDRVVGVAVAAALDFGLDVLACASTGNLAASVAAHAARAGLRSYVFIPADLEPAKIVGTAVYGTNLVPVRGSYDDVNRLCAEVADTFGWGFVNINLRPFYAEGSKTLAYETAEQLGWRAPDHVVVPIAGGSVLSKIGKGFQELRDLGWIPQGKTRISGAQAAGCAPVSGAFARGADRVTPVRPHTIAKSLAIGNPADGDFALRTIRSSGGAAEAATDAEIVEGMRLLAATEGIFTETAGGVTVACARKLARAGRISPEETVVLYITGNGLKTLDALVDALPIPAAIEPRLEAFEGVLSGAVA
jgi:threonine synthase